MDQQQGLGQSQQVNSSKRQIIINAYKSKLDLDPNMENALSPTKRRAISSPRDLLHESSVRPQLEPSVSSIHETSVGLIHESSVSLTLESNNVPTSGSMQKSLLNEKASNKTHSWREHFKEFKNEHLKSEIDKANQLNDRFDELKKMEENMMKTAMKTQEELVKNLAAAHNIELQQIDILKKIFNIDK